MRASEMKESLSGCDSVYKFTLRQLLISRANVVTLVIMVMISLLAPPLLSVISSKAMDSVTSFMSSDPFSVSQSDGITDIYIVNETPYAFDVSAYATSVTVHALSGADEAPTAGKNDVIYKVSQNEESGGYSVTLKLGNDTEVDTEAAESFSQTVASLFDNARYTALGITEDKLTVLTSSYSVTSGDASDYLGSENDLAVRFIVEYAYAVIVLVLCSISIFYIIRAVIEEKASKLVETLLTSVKPLSLIVGKILAVMTYIIILFASIIISAFISSKVTALVFDSPISLSAIGLDISSLNMDIGTLLLTVIALLLGYLTYSVLAGISGACCSNMEEADAATGTVMIAVMVGYFASMATCAIDSASLAYFTSLCPILSTFCAPVRYVLGQIGLGAFIISLIIQAAIIALLFVFCSKVYAEIVIRRGSRIRLGELMRLFSAKKEPK